MRSAIEDLQVDISKSFFFHQFNLLTYNISLVILLTGYQTIFINK